MICLAWLMSLAAFMCVVNVALCVCVRANVKCNNNNNNCYHYKQMLTIVQ